MGASGDGDVICAINEARGVSPVVGITFVNLSTGEAILSQICDTQFYVKTMHKLALFQPTRILLVSSVKSANVKSGLLCSVEETQPGIPVKLLDRKYWSETAGLDFIRTLAFYDDLDSIQVALDGKFYATSSFSAVSTVPTPGQEVHQPRKPF